GWRPRAGDEVGVGEISGRAIAPRTHLRSGGRTEIEEYRKYSFEQRRIGEELSSATSPSTGFKGARRRIAGPESKRRTGHKERRKAKLQTTGPGGGAKERRSDGRSSARSPAG